MSGLHDCRPADELCPGVEPRGVRGVEISLADPALRVRYSLWSAM
ncbi:MAG TPA: hypothetical protein VII95_12190 [Terriglobales bacterium]|jgi:hypothetical protein